MQLVRSIEQDQVALVGFAVPVLLLSDQPEGGVPGRRLLGLGSRLVVEAEVDCAVQAAVDRPSGFGLFVIDCDGIGGLEAGRRAFFALGAAALQVPVILLSSEARAQAFPDDRSAPIVLRAPVSAVSLRVGFEHALRDRPARTMFSSTHAGLAAC